VIGYDQDGETFAVRRSNQGVRMPEAKIPYATAYGNVSKALEKIQPAATPERFTQDFLATKLGLSGGGARAVIPFLKRSGFLASDGSPTDRYKAFRAASTRGSAAAAALRQGYAPLYELNEYAHALDDERLKDLIIQVTGAEKGTSTISAIVGSFRALQSYADFDSRGPADVEEGDEWSGEPGSSDEWTEGPALPGGLTVGYTINLHLPATSHVAVFNAIFKSLRENLLR
jgi:hypothetical protein